MLLTKVYKSEIFPQGFAYAWTVFAVLRRLCRATVKHGSVWSPCSCILESEQFYLSAAVSHVPLGAVVSSQSANLWMKLFPFMVLVGLSRPEEPNVHWWFPLVSFSCACPCLWTLKPLQPHFTRVGVTVYCVHDLSAQTHVQAQNY